VLGFEGIDGIDGFEIIDDPELLLDPEDEETFGEDDVLGELMLIIGDDILLFNGELLILMGLLENDGLDSEFDLDWGYDPMLLPTLILEKL
jgi:hypothetical protein